MATSQPMPRGDMAGPRSTDLPGTSEESRRSSILPVLQEDPPRSATETRLTGVLCDGTWVDIGELLRSLPTRADIKALVADLKEELWKETHQIRVELSDLHAKATVREVEVRAVESRMSVLDQGRVEMEAQLLELWLEEQEDRVRCTAVRIKGLSETSGKGDLMQTLQDLFAQVLEEGEGLQDGQVLIEKAFRLQGVGAGNLPERETRFVIWHVLKTGIGSSRGPGTWGPVIFKGTKTSILPELSGGTLRCRGILRPLLWVFKESWIHLQVGDTLSFNYSQVYRSFFFKCPVVLPDLFLSLHVTPI